MLFGYVIATILMTLQFVNQASAMVAYGIELRGNTSVFAEHRVALPEVLLKQDRNFGLLAFDDQVRKNFFQEIGSVSAPRIPLVTNCVVAVFNIPIGAPGEGASELIIECANGREVCHLDKDFQLLPTVGLRSIRSGGNVKFIYPDASFSIEKTSGIPQVHRDLLSDCWNDGEFGGSPMPGFLKHGRITPSQAEATASGVCNEHVPSPKGKMCSVLHGNMQSLAEMTRPTDTLRYSISVSNKQDQRFSDWDPVDIRASDVLSAAEYTWKQIAMHVLASERELLINSGDSKLEDLVAARMKNAYRTFANNFSSDMYSSGSLSNQIGGLQHIVADTPTGTVGGIDANVWTFWRNSVFDLSDLTITMSATTIENQVLLPMWTTVSRGMGDQPDLIVMSTAWYHFFEQSQTSIKRYAGSDDAQAGFLTLKYKKADVIYDTSDSGIPTDRIYMLNTDYIKLKVHEDADLEVMDKKEPVNQFGEVVPFLWMGNMCCSNRKRLIVAKP